MCRKIEDMFPDWKEKIHQEYKISKNLIEMLPIFQQLVKDRNIDGIQEFYENVCTDTYDINDDRDAYFHQFLMQFCNMKEMTNNINKEPKTKNNYLCFKVVGNRGETNEFSFFTFFKKEELLLMDYKYLSFLMYNNLTGLETYLYKYEFNKPEFKEENEVQCNNLVLCFKLRNTENDNLIKNKTFFGADSFYYINDEFSKYGLTVRNTLLNGEDLIVVTDLKRTINLECKNLKYVLKQVEKELLNRFQDLHVYDNKGFFMLPGSVNSYYKTNEKHNIYTYSKKVIQDGTLINQEYSFYRCYYTGEPFYYFDSADFSKIASLIGFTKSKDKKNMVLENKIRYSKVGKERLEDLDKLLDLRQEEIKEVFDYFRIMANVLFYSGKNVAEVLLYMNDRNNRLYMPVSDEYLFKIFTFCKEDYENYLRDTKNGIKYTNEKIVQLLHIRSFEQKEMKQLIDKNEAEFREKVRNRVKSRKNYASTKKENEEKKNKLKEELLSLRENGLTNKEISEKYQMDIRKVNRLIGKDGKKQEINNEINKMISENKPIKEICNLFHVSESKVRRMKKALEEASINYEEKVEETNKQKTKVVYKDLLCQVLAMAEAKKMEDIKIKEKKQKRKKKNSS